ncbi:putative gustatory receptor 28a [Linepithema humile]|uniref:putative gustatory receptor 28a n=1 Tax=Linepithema humile TaxID=83485 RepID=UPI00062355E5|nr:PREDICTED: putative gustatory receptor 28a [Linepithema humile]
MDSKKKELLTSTGQSLEKISHLLGINLVSYMGRLYSLALVVLFFFFSQMSWRNICVGYCEQHLVRKFMITLQYAMNILLVLTIVGTSVFRPKQFAFPRREMIIVDSILESYGARFSDKDIFLAKHLQDAGTATAILFVVMKYTYDIIINNSFQSICYSVRSWYPIVCLLIMDGLFTHCINDMYLRFRELNKIAIQHSKEKALSVSCVDLATNSNTFVECNTALITKIRAIRYIHHELYVLATKINTNFGFHLLIASAICLNGIILLLHDLYYYMKANSGNTEILIFHVTFVSCFALRSLYISYLCQRSRNEFRRMAIILHDVFLEYKSLRAEMIHFSLQLVHEDLTFTAFGLYEINIPLMCSIAGAVITYLVMVIQLDITAKFGITNNNTTVTWSYTEDNSTLTSF